MGGGTGSGRKGWDGPVAPEWLFNFKTLAAAVQARVPVGKTSEHPGALRASFALRSAGRYKRMPRPKLGVAIRLDSPYAYIQNYGGERPGFTTRRRRLGTKVQQDVSDDQQTVVGESALPQCLAFDLAGRRVFTQRVGPAQIRAQHFIEAGVDDWAHKYGGIRAIWEGMPGSDTR